MKQISGGPLVRKSRILIDADGCPVVDECIALAGRFGVKCLILCDTSHVFEKAGARTLTSSKGADSVDFALVNLVESGDVVVTQDYGLAAMCLARRRSAMEAGGSRGRRNGYGRKARPFSAHWANYCRKKEAYECRLQSRHRGTHFAPHLSGH